MINDKNEDYETKQRLRNSTNWCLQTMRQLGLNMAFMIKSFHLGLKQFGSPKIQEELTETHFIR